MSAMQFGLGLARGDANKVGSKSMDFPFYGDFALLQPTAPRTSKSLHFGSNATLLGSSDD